MTRPNPSTDELQRANQRANKSEAEALEAAGISRSAKMEAVEEIDRLDGVDLAFGDGAAVRVCAENVDLASRSLREAGYVHAINPDAGPSEAPITVGLASDEASQ